MIEREVIRKSIEIEQTCLGGIVSRTGTASTCRGEYDGQRVKSRIAVRIGIYAELMKVFEFDPGFFSYFAGGCIFSGLPVVYETTGNSPPIRRIPAPDKKYLTTNLNDYIGGWGGIFVFIEYMSAFRTGYSFAHRV